MAATVRLATRLDVPLINALVHELAEVEGIASSCKATDAALNEHLFSHPPFHGPTVFILEVDAPTRGAVRENKHPEEAMSGTVVTKPMLESSGNEAASVKTSDGGVLRSTASVELMLFRSVSNVKYKGNRFFSEVSSPKSSHLQTNVETDMEEPVLEVFRSGSDVNLKEVRNPTGTTIAAPSQDVEAAPIEQSLTQASGNVGAPSAEVIGEFSPGCLVEDPDCEAFRSPCRNYKGESRRVVVGYAHVFPNYSTYLAKPGLQMEAFYIRKPYRKLKLGTMFLKKIAKEAVKLGMERMEWAVLYFNEPAIKFYEGMGARIKPGFRMCVIDGQVVLNCEP